MSTRREFLTQAAVATFIASTAAPPTEAEAKAAAAAKAKAQAEAEERRRGEGRKKPGKPAAPPSEEPDPKAQKNFTDPESRIMKTKDGFIQGYNAQAAVDATAQVIVAHGLDAKQSDQHQLAPIVDAIEANLGRKPAQLSADAGYCSDSNLAALEERQIDAYIAPGRAKHAGDGEGGGARIAAMRAKIKAGGRQSPYRLRKQLPEPVFGQIKQARGFRQFLLRNVEKVAAEWGLVCLAHNILKLAQGRIPSPPPSQRDKPRQSRTRNEEWPEIFPPPRFKSHHPALSRHAPSGARCDLAGRAEGYAGRRRGRHPCVGHPGRYRSRD